MKMDDYEGFAAAFEGAVGKVQSRVGGPAKASTSKDADAARSQTSVENESRGGDTSDVDHAKDNKERHGLDNTEPVDAHTTDSNDQSSFDHCDEGSTNKV